MPETPHALPAPAAERVTPPGLFTPAQAAAYLQIAPGTLAVWRCTKRRVLPYCKIGGLVRYRREDLDAFAAASMPSAAGGAA